MIHNKRFPRLPLTAGIDLFLIEAVSSTMEINSRLAKKDAKKSRETCHGH